jgi:hypothetical protein
MLLWVVCFIAGLITILLSPLLIGTVVKLLSKWARRYPDLTDIIAVLTIIVVGGVLLLISCMLAAVYHHLLTGTP